MKKVFLAAALFAYLSSSALSGPSIQPGQVVVFGSWCKTADEVREVIATGDDSNAYISLIMSTESSCLDTLVAREVFGVNLPPHQGTVLETVGTVVNGNYLVTIVKVKTSEGEILYTWHVSETTGV